MKGDNFDGNKFALEAIKKGAKFSVVDDIKLKNANDKIIYVEDTLKSLQELSNYHRSLFDTKVIGITGTNGKTSTAWLIASILKEAGLKVAQIGTLGIITDKIITKKGLTTPDPITLHKTFSMLAKNKFTHVIMEVSSHALDQHRVDDVDFDLAIFTNLTQDHLDYHKSMKSYYLAKSKLFKSLSVSYTHLTLPTIYSV